jgi:hypothetical protein
MLVQYQSTTMMFFKKIIEYTFEGTKELKVVFLEFDWFDPINDTSVDDFNMVKGEG